MIKILSLFLSFSLLIEQGLFAQTIDLSHYLANPAKPVPQSDKFRPLHLRYLSYDRQANDFNLLLDKGDFLKGLSPKGTVPDQRLEEATQELMKYFFIGLALPNEKFWVNLRPDSPDDILDPDLEKTDIGRIFLEADLQLKKDTASFTSPQNPEGKAYWDKLYKKAEELFQTRIGTGFTIPTITRPWIVPGEIIIGEAADSAYIYKATLKVMLEEDYLTSRGDRPFAPTSQQYAFNDPRLKDLNQYSTQLIKETILPKLTYEVNTSKRYAPLRQVYYSLILAQWFKQKYGRFRSTRTQEHKPEQENPYIKLIDSGDLTNLAAKETYDKQSYFQQYQKSFKDGEYNLQEPVYTQKGQSIRRYMSGGVRVDCFSAIDTIVSKRAKSLMVPNDKTIMISVSSAMGEEYKPIKLMTEQNSKGDDYTVYHATIPEKLIAIAKEGLIPFDEKMSFPFDPTTKVKMRDIYVTTDPEIAIKHVTGNGVHDTIPELNKQYSKNPVLLILRLPKAWVRNQKEAKENHGEKMRWERFESNLKSEMAKSYAGITLPIDHVPPEFIFVKDGAKVVSLNDYLQYAGPAANNGEVQFELARLEEPERNKSREVKIAVDEDVLYITNELEKKGVYVGFAGGIARKMVTGIRPSLRAADIDIVIRGYDKDKIKSVNEIIYLIEAMTRIKFQDTPLHVLNLGKDKDSEELFLYKDELYAKVDALRDFSLNRLIVYKDKRGWVVTSTAGGNYAEDVIQKRLSLIPVLRRDGTIRSLKLDTIFRCVRLMLEFPDFAIDDSSQKEINEIVDGMDVKDIRSIKEIISNYLKKPKQNVHNIPENFLDMFARAKNPDAIIPLLQEIGGKRQTLFSILETLPIENINSIVKENKFTNYKGLLAYLYGDRAGKAAAANSSPINSRQDAEETAQELTEALLNPARTNERLFIWGKAEEGNITPAVLEKILKNINPSPGIEEEHKKLKLRELIIRVIIDSASLKDESEMSKSQRELFRDIINDAIDPSRARELKAHIKNYLGRLNIIDETGKEYYREGTKKIYDIAVAIEKNLLKHSDYPLLLPIFTICRKLFGLTVYKNPPKEPQIEIDDSYFIAKALITEYTRASRVAEHEDALLKMRPEEEEELDRYKDFPKEFIFKEKVFKKPATANLQYTFKNDTLYIRNPENEKDVWIVDGGDSPEYKNVFYIDWTDENNAFQKSDYEVIKVKGKKMLINRISNAIFDMPGGKIHLDMLINDNDGVKQLLSSSSAAEEQSKEHTVFTAADNTQYKIEGDFRPVYPDVKKVEAPNGEKMVIKPVRNRGGQEPEIRLAEELKHVGIVIGKLIQDNKGNKFLLMPYINGEALEGFAKREDIPLKDKLRGFSEIVSDLTEILAYLESLGYSYNDSRFSPQFDRHFIIEDSTRKLKLIDFEQVREEKNQYRRWLHNAIVLIDTVELLKNSLPVSLQNKFEQDLGLLYGKARNEDAVNNDKSKDPYQELCKKLKALINEIKDSLAEETSQEVALSADSPATISPKGGIDFTRPDIVTRQTNGLQSLVSGPLSINPDLDFEAEWSGIQTVFNAGIRPSTRRMAEFAASVAGSPMNSRRLDDLLGLIADILRREEEDEKLIPSDPALKELLTNL